MNWTELPLKCGKGAIGRPVVRERGGERRMASEEWDEPGSVLELACAWRELVTHVNSVALAAPEFDLFHHRAAWRTGACLCARTSDGRAQIHALRRVLESPFTSYGRERIAGDADEDAAEAQQNDIITSHNLE